ncbi:relaxase/mobilization nuclease domain-containing protein, partial [Pseudomonas sp. ESBL1]|uniref:relaxase/mobilization nuclease domain-containing protein n=1 Tax=Pseudomonas sp. ESBL1 TaxID=3077324 RepID=UPI002FC6CED0
AKVYTSGCLSFDESDVITEEQKYDIMADFEDMLFTGLEANRYCGYWVEHTDKGRLELNFVYPNVDLVTGKTLQVYYHARDLALVDAWKDLTNAKYGLKDPNAAENRRIIAPTIAPQIMEGWEQSAKPKLLEKLIKYRDIDGFKQQLTDILLA